MAVPRIHAELRRLDRRVNRKRVERIIRERDIAGHPAQAPVADLSGEESGARRGLDRPRLHARSPGRKLVGDEDQQAAESGAVATARLWRAGTAHDRQRR
ncbi:IS3 family transposase [Streptomyces sp. NPDC055709]